MPSNKRASRRNRLFLARPDRNRNRLYQIQIDMSGLLTPLLDLHRLSQTLLDGPKLIGLTILPVCDLCPPRRHGLLQEGPRRRLPYVAEL